MIFEDNADDKTTLKRLSTLSREFRGLAQELLFRKIEISIRSSQRPSRCGLLVRLFTSSLSAPPLQEWVRHLSLSFPTISDSRIDPWFITLLAHLNRLTHLTIDIHHTPEPVRATTEHGNIRHGSVKGTTYLDPQPDFVQLVQALTTLPNTPIDLIDVHILLEERERERSQRYKPVPILYTSPAFSPHPGHARLLRSMGNTYRSAHCSRRATSNASSHQRHIARMETRTALTG